MLPEFWSVVTHPASTGRPTTPTQAAAFVRALVAAGAAIWLPGPGFGERLMQVARDLDVSGPRIFDLQIALTAFEGGATEIWTHDAELRQRARSARPRSADVVGRRSPSRLTPIER